MLLVNNNAASCLIAVDVAASVDTEASDAAATVAELCFFVVKTPAGKLSGENG